MIDKLKKNEKLINSIAIVLIIAYPLLFVWQGLDFTDMGLWLTGYQQFLIAPEGISSGLLNWLSYALGWLVSIMNSSIISFRIAFVIITWLTLYFVYLMLYEVTPKNWLFILLPVLFLTELYVIAKTSGNYINYNNLTALFYILTVYTLYRGLTTPSLFFIGLSGFFVGFNVFVRFPNLLGIFFVLIIIIWGWSNRYKLVDILRQSGSFFLGVSLAIILTLFFISLFEHMEYYLDGLVHIFLVATDVESHHSSGKLFKLLIKDHFMALISGLFTLFVSYHMASLLQPMTRTVQVLILLILSIMSIPILNYSNSWKWIFTGTMYIVLFLGAGHGLKNDKPLMLLCLLAVSILFLVPMGSNNGMYNALYGSWLALPLVVILFIHTLNANNKNYSSKYFKVSLAPLPLMIVLMSSVILFFSMGKFSYTQRDHPNRFLLTHSIAGSPLLNGVYTTKIRSRVVGELLNELNHRVKAGDFLLTYNEIPLLHYLTKTQPWLGGAWIMLSAPEVVRKKLKQKIVQGEALPLIVRARGDTSSPYWPVDSRRFRKNSNENEIRLIFSHFEKENEYNVIWSNDFFEILKHGR